MGGKITSFKSKGYKFDQGPSLITLPKHFEELFDDIDENFHKKLYKFLSLPIEDIEKLWEKKKIDRKIMVNKFFTSSTKKSSGKLSYKIIFINLIKG